MSTVGMSLEEQKRQYGERGSQLPMDQRSIFRPHALRQYYLRRQQDVLLRLSAPPSFVLLWVVLLLCLSAGLLAWSVRLPLSLSVSGVIIPYEPTGLQALLFAPGEQQERLRTGELVQLDLGTSGLQIHLAITSLSPQVLSPVQIRTRYHLDSTLGLAVRQPAVVAVVLLSRSVALALYAGSPVNAEIQTGSRSVLSLLFFPEAGV